MKEVTRAIILDEKNNVLLGKRTSGAGGGKYALVGGKPDKNEDYETAIIREVKEEIGLNFEPKFYIEQISLVDCNDPWKVIYFTGKVTGKINLNTDEIINTIYVSRQDLDKYDIAFDHKQILENFFEYIKPRF